MPAGRVSPPGAFDLSGFLLLSGGMVAVSLSFGGVSELGLRHATVVVLMVFGLASLAAYWLHALRHPAPLFSPHLFSVASLRVGLLGNLFARLGSSCMPFLVPLLMQVSMRYSPAQAGMMMLPMAAAGMAAKPLVTRLILRAGYRRVLVANTLALGSIMASFAFIAPGQPVWTLLLHLACFGMVNSMQFTAMNTITLKDMEGPAASSGNSLLSMVQMLAMGLGVAVAASVLAGFTGYFDPMGAEQTLTAFHATFVVMGLVTIASAWIFWQLEPDGPGGSGPAQVG